MIEGESVSTGVGYGKAIILKNKKIIIKKRIVDNPEVEIVKLENAVMEATKEIDELIKTITGTEKEIMEAYLMIMKDSNLILEPKKIILETKCNSEYAVEIGLNKLIQTFEEINDEYMSSRAKDITDIKNRILIELQKGKKQVCDKLEEDSIIITKNITASDLIKMDLEKINGIVTEEGNVDAHFAIIAKAYNIPVIVKAKNATKKIKNNEYVIVDGYNCNIHINPNQDEVEKIKQHKNDLKERYNKLEKYKDIETKTTDGYKIKLYSNIGLPVDIKETIRNNAEGIGLFRSEILYMNNCEIPTEEYQYNIYKKIATELKGKNITIRTIDIGGDKRLEYIKLGKEQNPFLGYRAIRFCLENRGIFKSQLRAILRASQYGNLSIMFPMISSIEELREAKKILEKCKKELNQKGEKYNENIRTGIMIEVPSSALMAEHLAKECDFFSIGTNDLIQYTIAVERGNNKVSKLYTKYHPAVLKLIEETVNGAHKAQIECGMCGECAEDKLLIPLLIGLGIDELSVNPNMILKTRKEICKLEKTKCVKLAKETLCLSSANEVEKKLKEFMEGIIDENKGNNI